MHTRASTSELIEPLPEPERTLNRRLRRRNRRVPYDQRNNPPQHPRIVYPPVLNINHFRHFLDILQNYDPMDDEPMWAADHVVALTPGSTITIPETTNEFAIKGNHLTLVKENQFNGRTKTDPHKHIHEFLGICDMFKYRDIKNEAEMLRNCHGHNLSKVNIIKIFYHGLSEITQEVLNAAAGGIFLYKTQNQAYQLLEDKVLLKLDWLKIRKPNHLLRKPLLLPMKLKNMLVEAGKFTFPVDFVIIEMEEDSKVPLILGRPFLHTADAVIRVKHKKLNLGVGTERMGSKIRHSIEGTLLEEEIFAEFDEFMAMAADENSDSESDTEDLPFKKITINTDYKIKTSLEEPPMDLELKPLPDNLEYVFLEEPSFLLVIISSQLSKEKKYKLISVLKKHKQAFAWKTTDIPSICPSFCKHKIQLLDDKKPIVEKQRRLNPNMQEVVKKEIVKLLDTGIIYLIADSPWVSPIHCVLKKCGITVVTNENDELVPTRNVTLWRLLEKDTSFEFDDECQKAFESLKEKLTCAPVIVSPNWNLLFEHMCDASDLAVGAVLEIEDRKGTKNVAADHLSIIENDETSDDSEVDDKFPRETLMEINTKNEPWFADFANYLVDNLAIWSRKLDDALWAFRTAYKTPTGTTPYKLIYGKNCHLPFEIEHRAYWALMNCNPDLIAAGEKRMFQLHELDELRHQA
ncbi:reverse transcriptase domain-containing protein [Tanacetum coccineum]